METLKKVVQQTSWQVLGKATTSLTGIILLGIITRSYGEAGTGVFTLALAYLNFFYFASDLGLNAHLLPKLDSDAGLIFRKLLGLRISWSVILVVISLILLPLYPFSKAGFPLAVLIGSPAIILSAVFISCSLVLQKQLKYELSSISLGIGAVIATLVIWLITKLNFPPSYLLVAHLLDWLVALALVLSFIKKFFPNLRPIFDPSFIKATLSEVWLLSLTFSLSLVYFRIDTFILSSYHNLAAVGVYNVPYQLFQSALLGSTFIINSYYPLMLKALKSGKEMFFKQIIKACFLMAGLAVIGTIFTRFSAGFFIHLVTGGKGFMDSVEVLRILALSFPAFFISAILMWTLITLKRYKALIFIYLTGLAVNILLNSLFIPQYSYFAASWVTVASEYLILIMQLITLAW